MSITSGAKEIIPQHTNLMGLSGVAKSLSHWSGLKVKEQKQMKACSEFETDSVGKNQDAPRTVHVALVLELDERVPASLPSFRVRNDANLNANQESINV